MSVLTEWFEGHQVDDELERVYWGRVVTELACAVCLGLLLAGCASPSPRSEVCFLRLLGNTEDGMSVVAQACMTPEEFAESQK